MDCTVGLMTMLIFQYPQSGSRPCRSGLEKIVVRLGESFSTLKAGRDLAAISIASSLRLARVLSVPSKRVETFPPTRAPSTRAPECLSAPSKPGETLPPHDH